MSKDIRIDVIYYKTPIDVTLEMQLYGEYPLRLLNSSCNDLRSFFHNLKRAVKRSEIILVVGGYGEGENIPGFLARSIGQKCVIPNYGKEGIITDAKHILPKESRLLKLKSREFCGFLIEHGPQTIISLTDDRELRLQIAKEYLGDYIAEHHNVFNRPYAAKNKDGNREEPKKADESPTAFTDVSSGSPENSGSDAEAPVIESPSSENEPSPGILGQTVEIDIDDFNVPLIFEDAELDTADPDDEDKPCYAIEKNYSRRKRRAIRVWCIILSLLIVLMTVGYAFLGHKFIGKGTDFYEKFHNIYTSHGEDISTGFQKVQQHNASVFTWLKADALSVDHPVFSVADTNNGTYLTTLPDGTSDPRGTLFSKTNMSVTASAENALIYGNADTEGLLFGLSAIPSSPEDLLGSAFTASDARFMTNWQIFSVFTDSSANGYDYKNTVFDGDEQYAEHLTALKGLSLKQFDHEFFGKEKLMLLIGVTPTESYIAVAYLTSVRVLEFSDQTVNSSDSSDTSSDISSEQTSSDLTSTEPTIGDAEGDNDYHGDSSDIILPPPPVVSDTSSTESTVSSSPSSTVTPSDTSSESPSNITSSNVSSETQSVTSSQNSSTVTSSSDVSTTVSSNISSVTASEGTTTNPSSASSSTSSDITSAQPSSSADTSTNNSPSSNPGSSSDASSAASSGNTSSGSASSEPKPNVDPIYTWDIELSIIDNATGIKYTGSAVNIVAMIIEDEMSPTIDPPEALIAQSVVKYNWLINNGARNPAKPPSNALDPHPTPQAIQYATAAKGMVLMYGNTLAKTYCYAYSAGKTACYQDIWGGTAYPYLQSVDCSVDESLKDFKTSTTYSAEQIKAIISKSCGIDVSEMPKADWLKPTKYDANGLYCLKISIGGKEYNGRYLRETLLAKSNTGVSAIRSTAYEIVYDEEKDTFTVTCKGYGHGVGFSQRGAKAYANQGWTHEDLLLHFFPGTTLIKN